MHSKYDFREIATLTLIACVALPGSLLIRAIDTAGHEELIGYHISQGSSSSEDANTNTGSAQAYKLCFLGDNHLASFDNDLNRGQDPYQLIHPQLDTCDLIVANLETNISREGVGHPEPKGYNFRIPPEKISFMVNAGIDVVSLANNHTMDFGPDALLEQMSDLLDYKIQYFGAGKNYTEAYTPRYVYFHGVRIAFVGANSTETWITAVQANRPGSAVFNTSLIAEMNAARANADLVIPFLHWGAENSTVIQSFQRTWAHQLIDAGADIIVGAGPHVRQDMETYAGKQIFYSLGNFAVAGFAGIPGGTTGTVLEVTIKGKNIVKTHTYDVGITYEGYPVFSAGSEKDY